MSETFEQIFERAKQVIPGGVNSPVRAFGAVGGVPVFMKRAKGAYLWDERGKRYLDYVGSWGPMILGHKQGSVIGAIKQSLNKGISFGTATLGEIRLAEKIISMMTNLEMVRLVNSGTEATMSAVRLARAYTKHNKIIKFGGCYHGHGDSFLVQAGSGATTLGVPTSPGVSQAVVGDTLIARFNDIGSVRKLLEAYPKDIAAVIIEPIVGNAGVIPARIRFLRKLREITAKQKILLIFDEVMTGFRVAPGGAQQLYKIQPDLTTLGKVIGGGMPIGAFGGKREIMELLAPAGPVYQAGTLSGNPVAVAAGLATLNELHAELYATLEQRAKQLESGIRDNLQTLDMPCTYQRVGSMACLFFTDRPVRNFEDALTSDTKAFGRYYHAMLERGIYLPPSQFEAFFLSGAHSEEDIEKTIKANYEALNLLC
jgi:glutamate-1-semialdehyde 2,1-aminomutase